MTGRKRAYYTENQIQKNLFTNGKEWMTLDDWKEYSGPYHKYSTGEVFTEIDWIPNVSKKLVAYRRRSDMYFKYVDLTEYNNQKGNKQRVIGSLETYMGNLRSPVYTKLPPNDSDFTNGYMKRFFAYKRNEQNKIFFEIDAAQAKSYADTNSGTNHMLYGLLEIKWKLTGPEFDEYYNGILIKSGVVDTNSRIIEENSKKFRIFESIVNNPREYTVYDENF
jgi:hypothetical protein